MNKMKTLRNIRNTNPIKLNSNTTVDKDVQSMLFPLNLMQYIMFCPKYRIKDNIITPTSLISKCVSIIGTLAFMLALIHCVFVSVTNHKSLGYNYYMCVISIVNCVFYCLGFATNCVCGLIRTKNDVQFVLTFQKVHRFVNSKTSYNNTIFWSWVMVIEVLGFYSIGITYFNHQIGMPFFMVYGFYLLLVFDFNIVYAVRVIHVLKNKVELLKSRDFNSENFVHEDNHCTRVFQTYVDIFKCYDNFKYSFQQLILYYIIKAFFRSLIYIKAIIDMSKAGMVVNNLDMTILLMMFAFITMVRNLMWQTILIKQCKNFYSAIQSVQDTCTLNLKSACSEYEKNLCKNVLRLHRASFSKVSACSLFYVDAALQFNLMCLITSYTVVFLQFAFL